MDEPKRPMTGAERERKRMAKLRAKAIRADLLAEAAQQAYGVLCAGQPPHSAREANARRILRQVLEIAP